MTAKTAAQKQVIIEYLTNKVSATAKKLPTYLVLDYQEYVEENVSTKVVKIIQSYTGVVDKMVW